MSRAALGAVALVAAACGSPAPVSAPVDAGASAALVADHADCARCHRGIAESLAASWHGRSWTDPLFQSEWQSAGRPEWCVGCHAPLASGPDDPAAGASVGCAACHVRGGVVVASEVSGRAPHATALEPRLAESDACAACHQFDFPRQPGLAMQSTLAEHARSGRRERCQDCHMPRDARGRPSHAFAGAHDPAMWERALAIDVRAERGPRGVEVRAVLRTAEVGHAVPTGDLYRRLVLRVSAGGASREAELSRVFERGEVGEPVEIADQRVLPGVDRVLALALPARSARSVRWQLTWHALPAGAAAPEGTPEEWVRRVVAEGVAPITSR